MCPTSGIYDSLIFVHSVKEMRLIFPNSHRINRGNYVVKELAEACRANNVTDLIVLHEHRGVPGEICRECLLLLLTKSLR